jgi:hypothetical protein
MLAAFEREIPHLSLWTLLRATLRCPTERERDVLQYHLEEGGCRRCRRRAGQVSAAALAAVRFDTGTPLVRPAALGAGTAPAEAIGRSDDGALEAELFQENGQVVLELRTREAAFNHRLVGFLLRGERGPVEGFMVLQPDVDGWYTAEAAFAAGELHAALGGACHEVVLIPVAEELLAGAERDALLASAERARRDSRAGAAWRTWLEGIQAREEGLSREARPLMQEVRALLAGQGDDG